MLYPVCFCTDQTKCINDSYTKLNAKIRLKWAVVGTIIMASSPLVLTEESLNFYKRWRAFSRYTKSYYCTLNSLICKNHKISYITPAVITLKVSLKIIYSLYDYLKHPSFVFSTTQTYNDIKSPFTGRKRLGSESFLMKHVVQPLWAQDWFIVSENWHLGTTKQQVVTFSGFVCPPAATPLLPTARVRETWN